MLEITRIVPGIGGDIIYIGGDKKAVVDTSMPCYAHESIKMVKEKLGGAPLDYIILSHSHYDHVGGLSAFRNEFPDVKVLGQEHCIKVFKSESAKKLMQTLSENACDVYGIDAAGAPPFDSSGNYLDYAVKTGDILDMGNGRLEFYNTPGHTKCSISIFEPESKTLITSESSGILQDLGWYHVPVLTGFADCIASIDLCESLDPAVIFPPHLVYRTLDMTPKTFFEESRRCAYVFKDMAIDCLKKGMSDEEAAEYLCKEVHDKYIVSEGQPKMAFILNTLAFINVIKREFSEELK